MLCHDQLQSILENVCYEEEDAFIIRRQLTSSIELPRMNESDAKEPTTIQFIADTTLAARIEERVNNALLNLPTNDGVKINRITCHDLRSARIRGLGFFLVARMIVDNNDLTEYPLFVNWDKTIPVIELQQGKFTKPAASVSDFVTGEDFDPTQPVEEYVFNDLRVGFYIPVISLGNKKDCHFANCATPKETFEAAEQVREYWEEFLNSFRQQTMNVFVPVTLKIRSIELVNHPTARIWYFRVVWRTVSNDGFPGSFFALFSTDAKQWRHEISFHETVPDIASMAGVSADLQTNLVLEKLTDNATKDDEHTIESRSEDAWQQVVNNQIQIALGKFSGDSKINWQVSEIRKVKLAHVGVVYRIELQTDDPLWDGHKNHFYFGQNGRVPSMIAKWRMIPNAEVPLR